MPQWMHTWPALPLGIVFLGLCLGSFLNVLIYRLPLGLSVVKPRSHCPRCRQTIHAWDNIPLLSYLLLRGRCRHCGVRIPLRYPIVELLGALCLVVAALASATPAGAAIRAAFLLSMVVVFFVDLDHRIIPDEISLGGIAVGLAAAPLLGLSRLDSVIGAAAGAGGLLLIALGYQKLRGMAGMGGGDIKLAAAFGAFMGWQGLLLTMVLGSFLGSAIGIGLLVRGRATAKSALPFGCFLAPAAAVVLLYGPRLWAWYLG
ncbi:MAG: prepilin peptidase [Candidatus Eisenbacteria bacterium]